jgi:hypothetical protein
MTSEYSSGDSMIIKSYASRESGTDWKRRQVPIRCPVRSLLGPKCQNLEETFSSMGLAFRMIKVDCAGGDIANELTESRQVVPRALELRQGNLRGRSVDDTLVRIVVPLLIEGTVEQEQWSQ